MGGGFQPERQGLGVRRCGIGAAEGFDPSLEEFAGVRGDARAAVAEYRAEIAIARRPRRRRGGEVVTGDRVGEVGPQALLMACGIGEQIHVPPHVLAGEVEKRLGRLQDRR